MKYDFLKQKFEYESSTKTPEQNKVELEAMQMGSLIQPTFSVTDDHIAGTRTSTVIFTPTVSEAWTVDALIGKYAVAFVNTDTATFSVHKIGDNDATSLTIDATYGDSTLLTSCDRVIIFDSWVDALDSCTWEAKDDSVDVTGDLAVSGDQTIAGTLGVTGAVTATAAISVGTTLGVTGIATLSDALNVGGTITLENDETITNAVNGEVLVTGDFATTGTADIRGTGGIIMENDETITNAVNGEVLVTGDLATTGSMDVRGTAGIIMENDETITNTTNGQIDVNGFFGVKGGTTGGYVIKAAEATSGALSGASGSIAVNVPEGAKLLGTQFRVDTLITSGDGATSWKATYATGSTEVATTGQAFTKNTKVNAFFDANAATDIMAGILTITIEPNSNTFSAGVVRAISYYAVFEAMADAA